MISTPSSSYSSNFFNNAFNWLIVIIVSLAIHLAVLSLYQDKPAEKKGTSLPGIHIGLKTLNSSKPSHSEQKETAKVIEQPIVEKIIEPKIKPKVQEVKPKKKTANKTKNPKVKPKVIEKIVPTPPKVEQVVIKETTPLEFEQSTTEISEESSQNNDASELNIAQEKSVSGGGDPKAVADYKTLLSAWLEKHKRYPSSAKRRGQQDIIEVSFSIDKSGNILSYEILTPSRYKSLNKAIKKLMNKASPVPAPPSDLTGLSFSVPISFVLQ